MTSLVFELKIKQKITVNENITLFFSNSKAKIRIINEKDIDDVFESIYGTLISNIQKSQGKGSCWIID